MGFGGVVTDVTVSRRFENSPLWSIENQQLITIFPTPVDVRIDGGPRDALAHCQVNKPLIYSKRHWIGEERARVRASTTAPSLSLGLRVQAMNLM